MTDKYAHLRPMRSRQCYRADGVPKYRFGSKAEANPVAEHYSNDEITFHSYECPLCGFWHVAHDFGNSETNQEEAT